MAKEVFNHIVVVGRIPNYDNVALHYSNMTIASAKKQFVKDLYAVSEPGSRKVNTEMWGVTHYIDFIFTADCEIKEQPLH